MLFKPTGHNVDFFVSNADCQVRPCYFPIIQTIEWSLHLGIYASLRSSVARQNFEMKKVQDVTSPAISERQLSDDVSACACALAC